MPVSSVYPEIQPAKILLSQMAKASEKGYTQVISNFKYDNKPMTEIVTDMGNGLKGTREIFYDITGSVPEKIVDRVAGRVETYVSASPERPGVIQLIGSLKSYLPNLSMEKLARY